MQGTRVQSLVRKLRSHMPHSTAKKKKKKSSNLVINKLYFTLEIFPSYLPSSRNILTEGWRVGKLLRQRVSSLGWRPWCPSLHWRPHSWSHRHSTDPPLCCLDLEIQLPQCTDTSLFRTTSLLKGQGNFKGSVGRERLSSVLDLTFFRVQRQWEPKMLTLHNRVLLGLRPNLITSWIQCPHV